MTTFAPGTKVIHPRHGWAYVRFQVGRFVRLALARGGVTTADAADLRLPDGDLQAAARAALPTPALPAEPITDLQRALLGGLACCRFLPGSWAKRFVRDLVVAEALTPRQGAALVTLGFRYRRQLLGAAAAHDLDAIRDPHHRLAAFVAHFDPRDAHWASRPDGVSEQRWSDYNRRMNDLLMGRTGK